MIALFRLLLATAIIFFSAVVVFIEDASAQTAIPDIKILAYGIHYGGKVIYRYQVVNHSLNSIDKVELGIISVSKELPGTPWISNPQFSDTPSVALPDQCRPFAHMTCSIAVFQFDYMRQPKSAIYMDSSELHQTVPPVTFLETAYIRPGTSSSVAEIYVPSKNAGYLTAHGSVRLLDSTLKDATGQSITEIEVPFTKSDQVPPTLSGSASTVLGGHIYTVNINLSVKDNLDPNPDVILASVTANQKLAATDIQGRIGTNTRTLKLKKYPGRIYYLHYKAIDGSENVSEIIIPVRAG